MPSQVDYCRRGPTPFVACFKRFECEVAAAIYVEACRRREDRWQPLSPPDIGETLLALLKEEAAPPWAKFMATFGYRPDFVSLFDNGWFTKHADNRIEPTDLFFEVIERKGYVRAMVEKK